MLFIGGEQYNVSYIKVERKKTGVRQILVSKSQQIREMREQQGRVNYNTEILKCHMITYCPVTKLKKKN